MKRTKGFTLVELIIVIVIVGILSLVAVPVYKSYTQKAIKTEGKTLLGAVKTAEEAYFAEHQAYLTGASSSIAETLEMDVAGNKYFTTFTVTPASTAGNYLTITDGVGDASKMHLTMEWGATMNITETNS